MSLKIIVPVKRVVEASVRIRLRSDGGGPDIANAKMAMNPFDEIALEEAVRLREQGLADEVLAVSIGPQAAQETLRTALALGADRAVLVETGAAIEPLAIARILAAIVAEEGAHLVLMGKLSIDEDNNQTGPMLAGLLGWGQANCASNIALSQNTARVTCETDAGLETRDVPLPAVITADLRLNEPRYPSLPNIMKAKKKPLETRPLDAFGIDTSPRLRRMEIREPPERQAGLVVESVDDLIARLREADLIPSGRAVQ
ncbi:electron transfer flavoprotein subunit beta/FixA family protein [Devosia sp. Root635]|uniref:electron transfer flavoprotein subunit beta/FixA family protein n=1 Tax=Devosia sp. Root635 TaxID=1736575 RepID=UPI0006F83E69|nr:electron transfer flavoprotein subunit beta/FixA family protein [Devosia sp. Root635]KRA44846.1 electron transfer flavoprotein subunit beta [Devosia sp. Root635]